MTVIGALLLGVLIGLSLGALGGGGSILTVPALVYVLGESAHAATTSSLVIVGITAAVAAVGHARAGRVRWRAGVTFGAVGIASSFLGAYLNRLVAPDLLLLAFSGLMLVAAYAMLRQVSTAGRVAAPARHPARHLVAVGGGGSAGDAAPADGHAGRPVDDRRNVVVKVVLAGLLVGLLTGFLGVGGGFVIVPALAVGLGYRMPVAVGTSLLIIAINSGSALLARVGHESFHWAVIVPFTIAAIAGSVAGKRVADRLAPDALTRAFAVVLVLLAGYVAIRSAAAL